jgi:glycosyltransferase involved in cell wall biosynthesis
VSGGLAPYRSGADGAAGTAPVSVVVLTRNEAPNIDRCLASVGWAEQVLVLDCGSADDTVERAQLAGAEVVVETWRGYPGQREFALRLPQLRHDWVYFLDADEWVSGDLAAEIGRMVTTDAGCAAYAHRRRIVFEGRWIRHCGFYRGSWTARLVRRSRSHYLTVADMLDDRVRVAGTIGRLDHDLVDADRKGLAAWLRKHIGYAELEAARQIGPLPWRQRWRTFREVRPSDSRPLARAVAKDLLYPYVPARPLALFLYMYVLKLGFLDGGVGLRFCFYHAWYRVVIADLARERGRLAPVSTVSRRAAAPG